MNLLIDPWFFLSGRRTEKFINGLSIPSWCCGLLFLFKCRRSGCLRNIRISIKLCSWILVMIFVILGDLGLEFITFCVQVNGFVVIVQGTALWNHSSTVIRWVFLTERRKQSLLTLPSLFAGCFCCCLPSIIYHSLTIRLLVFIFLTISIYIFCCIF